MYQQVANITALYLQYFWEICCYHGEDVLPLSQEALDWRCHFRRLRHDTVEREKDREVFHSFRAVTPWQIELRIHQVSFPDEVQDRILDALYEYISVDVALLTRDWSDVWWDRKELHTVMRGAYNRLVEAYQMVFAYEWKIQMDGLFVAWLAREVSRVWLPPTLFVDPVKHQRESELGRIRVYDEWDHMIMAKFQDVFDTSINSIR